MKTRILTYIKKEFKPFGVLFYICAYILLALLFTYPLALHLGDKVVGHREGDMWKHLWGFWWVKIRVAQDGYFPTTTKLMNYPYGGRLFFIDPLGAFLSIPLQAVFSPAMAYNLVLLFNLALGAFCAFVLANYFIKNRAAAFFSGAAYAYSAYMLSNISSGISETFNIGWIPLFVYLFARMLREGKNRFAIPSAAVFFLAVLGSWYYGIITVLLGCLFFIAFAFYHFRKKPIVKTPMQQTGPVDESRTAILDSIGKYHPSWVAGDVTIKTGDEEKEERGRDPGPGSLSARAIVGLILALALILPPMFYSGDVIHKGIFLKHWIRLVSLVILIAVFAWLMLKRPRMSLLMPEPGEPSFVSRLKSFVRDPLRKAIAMSVLILVLTMPLFGVFKSTFSGQAGLVTRERTREYMEFYLSQYFHNVSRLTDYVNTGKQNADVTYTVDRLTRSSYAGWIVLVLALSSFVFVKKRKYYWFWAFSSLFFIILSLGPFLYVSPGKGLEKPFFLYEWLYRYFPFFDQVSIPYRFNLAAMLSLGILGGYSLSTILRRWNKSRRFLAAGSLCLALLFDVAILSPAPYPVELCSLKAPAIYRAMGAEKEDYGVFDYPIHRGKGELMIGEYFYYQTIHHKGIPYTVEGTLPRYVYENQFTLQVYRLEKGFPNPIADEEIFKRHLQNLKTMKIKYIVIHDGYMSEGAKARIHPFLEYFLGKPIKGGMGVKAYRVY